MKSVSRDVVGPHCDVDTHEYAYLNRLKIFYVQIFLRSHPIAKPEKKAIQIQGLPRIFPLLREMSERAGKKTYVIYSFFYDFYDFFFLVT